MVLNCLQYVKIQIIYDHLLGISGGVSFFTYFPTTPSFIVLKSFFLDSIFKILLKNNDESMYCERQLDSVNSYLGLDD